MAEYTSQAFVLLRDDTQKRQMYLVSLVRNRKANCEYPLVRQRKERNNNTHPIQRVDLLTAPRRESTACSSPRYVPFWKMTTEKRVISFE